MMKSVLSAFAAGVILLGTAWAYVSPERVTPPRSPKPSVTAATASEKADAPGENSATAGEPGREKTSRMEGPASAAAASVEVPQSLVTDVPAGSAPVQTAPTQVTPPAASAPSSTPEMPTMASDFPLTRALGGLGIVLTLLVGGVFATRKFAPQLFKKPASQKLLKTVESLQIGEKHSISVVQFEDKRYLIGNTSTHITLLAAVPNVLLQPDLPQARDDAPVEQPKASAAGRFRNIFEMEKGSAIRAAAKPKTIPPDIRAKMRQLRASLEQ